MLQPYNSTKTATGRKKSRFNLSGKLDFHVADDQLISVRDFSMWMLTSLSVDEILQRCELVY